jgi:hypothetical protein
LQQLEQLYATGVRAMVEFDPIDSESRRADLAWLSARSPIHILTSAGIAPDDPATGAMPNLPVRAGLQMLAGPPGSERASGHHRLPAFMQLASALDALSAIARVPAGTTVPLTVVADPHTVSVEDAETVLAVGVCIVLVARDDPAAMPALAATFKRLADLGFSDRVALGYAGDPLTVMERMPLFLMEADFTSTEVRQLLVDNPLRSLLIGGHSSHSED